MFSDLRFRLRAIFNRRAMEQELDEELAAHIEREAAKYVRQGLSRDEAMRRARIAFGGVDRIKEETRDARGTALLDALLQDVGYAWRGLRAKPGFTAAVLIALGMGIGANTAMFGIVDRLLLRPAAFVRDAERVNRVYLQYIWNGETRIEGGLSFMRTVELTAVPSIERGAILSERTMDVGLDADARELPVAAVSASIFSFFEASPVVGRFFTPDEDKTPAGAQVAVLGYDFWQSAYGGRAGVIGETMYISASPFTIIGVAPQGFTTFAEERTPVVYLPVTTFAASMSGEYYQNHGWSWLSMFVRRRPDISVQEATTDLTRAYQRSWELERESGGHTKWPSAVTAAARVIVAPPQAARGPEAGADARVATWVMGVAGVVLLIACANVANLLLARSAGRHRETALRVALGVTRRRLLQQLMTESVLLAALGGIVGLALAEWGGRVLRALFLADGAAVAVSRDGRTLFFVALISLGVALLTGLAPALAALRPDVAGALKAGQREGTYRRSPLRTGLLVFQGALSVVLLIGAGLFVRSLNNVRQMRLGFDIDPVVVVQGRVRGEMTAAQRDALDMRLLEAARSIPGVLSATPAASIPFAGNEGRGFPYYPGVDTARVRMGLRYMLQAGTPEYFATLGTRILQGRGFSAEDRANAPNVVVVNQALAERLWPGENPLGRQMRVGEARNPYMTVIGVAENMRGRSMIDAAENWYYLPWAQYRATFGGEMYGLIVRVNGRAEDYVDALRRRVQREMPGTSFVRAAPLRALVLPRQRSWEFGATMFVAFGALALGLAAIGLYSVIAYAVAQRSHEMGVRMALGATTRKVMGMVLRQGLSFAVTGLLVGALVSLWAGRWIEPLLFEQKARDPLVFVVVSSVLLTAALAASIGPAWRAMRVDPTVALRSD